MSVASERVFKRRAKLKLQGLCRSCGQHPGHNGRLLCWECKCRERGFAKRYREALIHCGLCVGCRKQGARPKKLTCESCAIQMGAKARTKYVVARMAAIHYYGDKCACCGEENEVFLQFDHINNDGAEHRRLDKVASNNMGVWLRRHGYPDWIRLLCANCNVARKTHGICPHDVHALMDDANSVPPAL